MELVVGLDGDDTLWHNEDHFAATHEWFADLLDPYGRDSDAHLISVERRNLRLFGYGVKGFTLSMVETAIEVSDGAISATDIHRIIARGHELLARPADLLDGVAETIAALGSSHRLLLVTKGDLMNQEAKVASSGLAAHFEAVEIVSEKDPATYARILDRNGVAPQQFVMVGNSLRSDVLPVIEIGGTGVHIPYHVTWELETVSASDADASDHTTLQSVRDLPDLLRSIVER